MTNAKLAKPKTCRNPECKQPFTPAQSMQTVCGYKCGLAIAEAKRKRNEAVDARVDRKLTKDRKEALKKRGDYVKEAQQAFNEFIRWRDRLAGHKCISSGKPLDWAGNQTDAGHYRSTGSAPHLRFDERNCHAQSKHDNRFLSGNAVDYRIGLIARIGLESVDSLEADQEPKRYTIDDLKSIKAEYRKRVREIKKAMDE